MKYTTRNCVTLICALADACHDDAICFRKIGDHYAAWCAKASERAYRDAVDILTNEDYFNKTALEFMEMIEQEEIAFDAMLERNKAKEETE